MTKQPKIWTLRAAAIMLILTCLTTGLTAGLFARYSTSDRGSDSGRAGAFVLNMSSAKTSMLYLYEIRRPGDSSTYSVTVKNNSSGKTSEVAETYRLTVQVNGSMPLTVSLKDSSNNNALTPITRTASVDGDLANTGYTYTFNAASGGTDAYTLTVAWPQSVGSGGTTTYYNDARYANASSVGELILTMDGYQVD